MIKYQKKVLLTEVGEPLIIRRKATESHNEITVAIATYALPLNSILPNGSKDISHVILDVISKAGKSFPGSNLEFNQNYQNPAFLFKVKAKTERRGDDPHDQAFADKIALSKVSIRACTVAQRIVDDIIKHLESTIKGLIPISQAFEKYADRESFYFRKIAFNPKAKTSE